MGRETLQIFSMIVILCVLAIQVIWISRNKSIWRYAVPMIVWMIHGFIFYLYVIFQQPTYFELIDWSAILRLHGYLTVLVIELDRLVGGK